MAARGRTGGTPPRCSKETGLEQVRREIRLGRAFSGRTFERAFARFRALYNVAPQRIVCAPDVLVRYCSLFETEPELAHRPGARILFEGVPLYAGILAPGTIAIEGEVDETRMGDW